jgi:hypothetical protein
MRSLPNSKLMQFLAYTLPLQLEREKKRHAGTLTLFNFHPVFIQFTNA